MRNEFPDMPKHQPCPKCHGKAKRESKTLGGANYRCNRCKLAFFVKGMMR